MRKTSNPNPNPNPNPKPSLSLSLSLTLTRRLKYDAILHADLDVDLLPSPMLAHRIASEWAERLPPLVSLANGGQEGGKNILRMLGFTDQTTPYNGGLFWAFPSGEAKGGSFYQEGLEVLSAPWDPHLGLNRAGPPSSLFPRELRGTPTERL